MLQAEGAAAEKANSAELHVDLCINLLSSRPIAA